MFDRAKIVDENFLLLIQNGNLPSSQHKLNLSDTSFSPDDLVSVFESQVISRHMDLKARELKNEGKCFYTIGSSGHEGNAVFGKVFQIQDMAFLHYRSAPFFIERSKKINGTTPIYDLALSFMASSDDPISGGRHKVIGSKKLNIVSQSSPTGTQYLQAVGAAFACQREKKKSIVYVSSGERTTSQGDFHEALNWASREKAPVIFHIQDNKYAISVPID